MIRQALRRHSILIAIILIGAMLRLWGINFGLPDAFKFDGLSHMEAALRYAGSFNFMPDSFLHGTLQPYLLTFEYAALYIILFLLRIVSSPAHFLAKFYIADPTLLFLMGRITQAAFGVGTVVLTYKITKLLFGKRAGLISAYLLSISFTHVQYSHYIKEGMLSLFLLLLAFLFAAKVFEKEKNEFKYLLLTGFFIGLAASAKYTALIGYVFLLASQLLTGRRIDRRFLLASAAVPAGFLVGQPYALLAGNKFISDVMLVSNVTFDSLTRSAGQTRLAFYFGDMLKNSIGLPVLVFSILSLYLLSKKDLSKKLLFVLSFPIVFNIFIISSLSVADRHLIPAAPFFAIMAAVWMDYFARHFPVDRFKKLLLAFMILAASLPITDVIRNSILLMAPDTRTIARNWIEENIPAGSTIAIEGAPASGERIITLGPNIKPDLYSMSKEQKNIIANGGRGFLTQQRMKYLEKHPEIITYRLYKEFVLTEEAIRRIQPEYVVLSGYFDFHGILPDTAIPSMKNHRLLYEKIEERYVKIKEFLPFPNLRWDYNYQADYPELRKIALFSRGEAIIAGPRIYVYKKK